jgi:lipooligosaccharide transport system permease protein
VFVVVAALLGGVTGPGILGALAAAVLTGSAVTALVTAYAATVELDQGFSVIFRLVVIPITLFSGTFFPIDRLPVWVQPLAWISPLWHGTELGRAAALDRWQALPALGHLAYLVALLALGLVMSARLFERRLAQ